MLKSFPSERAHGIDALRGLAAVGVVIVHAAYIHPLGVDFHSWNVNYFSLGVALFFVISAFSMCIAYSNGVGGTHIRSYSLRRFFRIAPLFYFMLIAWDYFYLNPSASQLLMNITFTFGFWESTQVSLVPAGWSIGVEAIFYLLFPVLSFWRGVRSSFLLLVLALTVCYLFNKYSHSEEPYFYWTNFLTNSPYFAFGILGWSLFNLAPHKHRKVLGLLCLFAGLSLMTIMFFYGPLMSSERVTSLPVPVGFVFAWGAAFCLLVLSQALYPIFFLVNRFTLFLGKISYGLYLMHPLFIYHSEITPWAATLTENPLLVMPIVAVATLTATIPIAFLLYVFVESPFIRLGRWMTKPNALVVAE